MIRKKILITAPEDYAQRLCAALRAASDGELQFFPVSVPLLCTELRSREMPADVLAPYDTLVLCSRKAIEAVAVEQWVLKDHASCYAIGKDREYLEDMLGRRSPGNYEPSLQGIADALRESGQQKRIAVLGPQMEGIMMPFTLTDFIDKMHAFCPAVDYLPVYTTRNLMATIGNLNLGDIDIVAFTSGGEAEVYRQMADSGLLSLPEDGRHPLLACFGPYTARCARDEGLQVDFVSPRYASFTDFACALRSVCISD